MCARTYTFNDLQIESIILDSYVSRIASSEYLFHGVFSFDICNSVYVCVFVLFSIICAIIAEIGRV